MPAGCTAVTGPAGQPHGEEQMAVHEHKEEPVGLEELVHPMYHRHVTK
jgi:hypothetical protein